MVLHQLSNYGLFACLIQKNYNTTQDWVDNVYWCLKKMLMFSFSKLFILTTFQKKKAFKKSLNESIKIENDWKCPSFETMQTSKLSLGTLSNTQSQWCEIIWDSTSWAFKGLFFHCKSHKFSQIRKISNVF